MQILNVSISGGLNLELTPSFVFLSTNVPTIVEGNTFTITFTTNRPGVYPYTITGINTNDISNASLTGSFTANGETRTYTVSDDLITEGRETFSIALDNGQTFATVGIDDSYYTLTANVASANEGNVFSVTLDTNAIHALPLGYTITGVSNVDFNGSPSMAGNFTANGQILTFTANLDATTEGTEYFAISLNNGRANANVLINDTSLTVPGQQEFTTAGTYSWVAPTGVSSISVVTVGAGSGGGGWNEQAGGAGGGLAWGNATVTPGQSYTIKVGAKGLAANYPASGTNGGYSAFGANVILATGGYHIGGTSYGGTYTGDGGGNGGAGGQNSIYAAGGGAGGYSGAGGLGGYPGIDYKGTAGAGGAGGGGGSNRYGGAGGGGVGIYGEGTSGEGGYGAYISSPVGGGGGSGGENAANVPYNSSASVGGRFGAGGGSGVDLDVQKAADGAEGAVRIIWGANRYYPSTNTANV
jgi:hypothetical protein